MSIRVHFLRTRVASSPPPGGVSHSRLHDACRARPGLAGVGRRRSAHGAAADHRCQSAHREPKQFIVCKSCARYDTKKRALYRIFYRHNGSQSPQQVGQGLVPAGGYTWDCIFLCPETGPPFVRNAGGIMAAAECRPPGGLAAVAPLRCSPRPRNDLFLHEIVGFSRTMV